MDATLAGPDTPFAVLDRGRLERNVRRLGEHLAGLGVLLRLHVKTATAQGSRRTTRPWSRSRGSWPEGPSCAGC